MYRIIFLTFLLLSVDVAAKEYQFELFGEGAYRTGFLDTNSMVMLGRVYTKKLQDSEGPLSEEVFLQKASYLQATVGTSTYIPIIGHKEKDRFLGIAYRHVSQRNLILGINISNKDTHINGIKERERNVTNITIGKYLTPASSITFDFEHVENVFFPNSNEFQAYMIGYKRVAGGRPGVAVVYSLDLQMVVYERSLSATNYILDTHIGIYPYNRFGVDFGLVTNSSEFAPQETSLRLSTNYYFNRNLYSSISAVKFIPKNGDTSNQFVVSMGTRF